MKLNQKHLATGLVAGTLAAAALAGGGVAVAAASGAPAPAASASAGPSAGYTGDFAGMSGMWSGQQPVLGAAAAYLGLSQAQLRAQLQAGNSLADVAAAEGKTVSGLKTAILAAVTSRINASTTATAGQKAAMIDQVKNHLDAMVDTDMGMGMGNFSGAGMGSMGRSMSGMQR